MIKEKFPKIEIPWLVMLIVTFGVILRLVNLTPLFHFTYDEEIFAFVGKRIFVNGHVPLIGGVTPMHVHLAPYFYWISGIILFFSGLNPVGWGVAAAVIVGLTMLVLYICGKTMFGKKIAVFAVIIYAFSFYQNIFDRHYWGLIFDGLISVIVILSLYKIIAYNYKYFILLAIILSFGIHTDPSTLVLVLLCVVAIFFYKINIRNRFAAIALIIFFLSFLPLVWFDLRHEFANSRGVIQYINEVKAGRKGAVTTSIFDSIFYIPRSLARIIYVFGDTDLAKQYSYCPQYATGRLTTVPQVISIIILGFIIWFIINRSRNSDEDKSLGIIKIIFLSAYIGVLIYGIIFHGDLFDHYVATLFPIFILVVSYFLNKLPLKQLSWVILSVFVLVNLYQLTNVKHTYGFADKLRAVNWAVTSTGNTDFSLDVLSSCFRYNGYRYLFYLAGKEPTKSYVDANFSYLYDKPPARDYPKYTVVITNPDFTETRGYFSEYYKYKNKALAGNKFGNIEVLIIDNSQLEFTGKF